MTSVEIPYSVACALPTLAVVDITNDVVREVASAAATDGIAFVTAEPPKSLVRVTERELGLFCDVEDLLAKIIPVETAERERLLLMLLGSRTEQIPFSDGTLRLGQWQRVLLFHFNGDSRTAWTTTIVG